MLPHRNGPELVAAIRADNHLGSIPLLLLAAAGTARKVIKAHAADFELPAANVGQLRDVLSAPGRHSTVAVMELPVNQLVGP